MKARQKGKQNKKFEMIYQFEKEAFDLSGPMTSERLATYEKWLSTFWFSAIPLDFALINTPVWDTDER